LQNSKLAHTPLAFNAWAILFCLIAENFCKIIFENELDVIFVAINENVCATHPIFHIFHNEINKNVGEYLKIFHFHARYFKVRVSA